MSSNSSPSPPLMQQSSPPCLLGNSGGSSNTSYLKSYPYLFVRETNQTDYFCTLCDHYLKEDDLQPHLFDVHKAFSVEDFFVRVTDPSSAAASAAAPGNNIFLLKSSCLYICVVCWVKIPHLHDTLAHRRSCKVNPSEEDLENGSVPMKGSGNGRPARSTTTLAINGFSNGSGGGLPEMPHSVAAANTFKGSRKRQSQQQLQQLQQQPHHQLQHLICSLCSMVVPNAGHVSHLREFHRVTCPIDDVSCPLCFSADLSLIDLPHHLSLIHGLSQQPAANAIMLWVLANAAASRVSSSSNHSSSNSLPVNLSHLLMMPKTPQHQQQQNGGGTTTTVLQSLLSKSLEHSPAVPPPTSSATPASLNLVESIVSKFTRCHLIGHGKESIQCLVCSKWFAVPPVKHLRGHMVAFKEEKQRIVPLIGGCQVCIICYDVFDSLANANSHLFHKHSIAVAIESDVQVLQQLGHDQHQHQLLLQQHHRTPLSRRTSPIRDYDGVSISENGFDSAGNELPTVITGLGGGSGGGNNLSKAARNKVELDNAGRVKSGKVRKQCELCGEWSNIKWFFKHMSEVHQALFCRCCREYLPIHEHEEHKHWHSEPPYMGQKIRIEANQPVIIDRKERASLTPIGSLASWGGSSGGKVVKAMDSGVPGASSSSSSSPSKPKRRKQDSSQSSALSAPAAASLTALASSMISSAAAARASGIQQQQQQFIGHMDLDESLSAARSLGSKDTLMPKEVCPVCGILITYKNLARHIKLRHKIKYKFCHRCRKLVPSTTFDDHKNECNEIVIDDVGGGGSNSSSGGGGGNGPTVMDLTSDGEGDREESIDPTDFLEEASSPIAAEEDDDDDGKERGHLDGAEADGDDDDDDDDHSLLVVDTRKSEEFRANTSKNKLESLMGKEFKHPRRRCAICGYSVSYSNFKRHLRNAHPAQYQECEGTAGGDFKKALATLSHEIGEGDEISGTLLGHVMDDDEDDEDDDDDEGARARGEGNGDGSDSDQQKDGKRMVECGKCGERILEESVDRHMKTYHTDANKAKDEEREAAAVGNKCPLCPEHFPKGEEVIVHCKETHGAKYKWCEKCGAALPKKEFRQHEKLKHESPPTEPEPEAKEEEAPVKEEGPKEKKKVYSCPECGHLFLSQAGYENHMKETHGQGQQQKEKEKKKRKAEEEEEQEGQSSSAPKENEKEVSEEPHKI